MSLVLRRGLLVLAALVLAALGAVVERQREHVVRVEIGEATDGRAAVSGWHGREQAWSLTGRWTDGHAVLATPRAGRHVVGLRLALCAHPRRPDDQVRISAGALDLEVVRLASECQAIDVPVGLASADAVMAITIDSAATSSAGEPRALGVFVDWVEVRADGPGVAWTREAWTRALITALLAAVMLAAWDGAALATGTRLTAPAAAAALAGAVAWTAVAILIPTRADLVHGALWAGASALVTVVVRAWRPGLAAPATTPGSAGLAWGVLALAAALAVLFRETIVGGRVLSQSNLLYQVFPWRAVLPADYLPGNRLLADVPLVFYPFLTQVRDAFAAWSFPLWSPRLYTGHPFFASFQSAVLSPFTWLAVAVPLPWGTVAGAAARLSTGGLGALLLARRFGLGTAACAFCAVAFALNTFSYVWLEHPLSAVAAWLPWLLWAGDGLARAPRGRTAAGLALLVGLTIVAGHPETAFKVLAVGGLYGLAAAMASPQRWRAAAWLVSAYALGLLLSAIQVLPFAEYLEVSRVHAIRQTITSNPYYLPGDVAVTTAVPDFWGDSVTDDYVARTNRIGVPTNYAEQQIYPGVVAWVLAIVGVAAWRRRWRIAFFLGAATISAAFIFSVPTIVDRVISLPVLRITMVSRFGLILVTSVILLAGFGLDALVHARARTTGDDDAAAGEARRARRLGWAAGLGAALIAAGVGWAVVHFQGDLAAAGLLTRTSVGSLFAAALAALVWALAQGRAGGRVGSGVFGLLVCGLVAAELLADVTSMRAFVRPAEVFPRLAGLEAIRRDPGLFRVAGIQHVLPANTAMAYGLSDPRGYDGMGPRALSDLLDVSFNFLGSYHFMGNPAGSAVVNLLNVKYVLGRPGQELPAPQFSLLAAGEAPIFLNHDALPRTFLADGFTVLSGNAARRALRDGQVDLRRVVVLDTAPPAGAQPKPAIAGLGPGRVQVRHYRDRYVEIATEAPGRRLLVLTDLHYPGWIADVDGATTPILVANFAFRAVSVPAGTHTVRFVYQPRSFTIGATLSGLAGLTLMGIVWGGRGRQGRTTAREKEAEL